MKLFYLLPLLFITACGHTAMLTGLTEINAYNKTIPDECVRQVQAGIFSKNMEGFMSCRQVLLMNKAKEIDFGNTEEMETVLSQQVDLGRQLDAKQITQEEFMAKGQELNCQMAEVLARSYKNMNISARSHDFDKKIGEKCRSQIGVVSFQPN